MLTSLFSLFYVTGEFHRFLHRGRAKNSCAVYPKINNLWYTPRIYIRSITVSTKHKASKKLIFRLFADDTNIFYSWNDLNELGIVINEEFSNVLKYCAANKLSINRVKKTNYKVIKSARKNIVCQ